MYRVLVVYDPDPKTLKRLLQRHDGKVITVAILIEVEKYQQLAAISRHYGAKPLNLPPQLLLEGGEAALTCRLLLDTSVIVTAYLGGQVRELIEAIGRHCQLLYSTYYTTLDVEKSSLNEKIKRAVLSWAAANLSDAGYLSVDAESRVFGRYGRWVKRIKKVDAAIAYLALERGYIFTTGDWLQLQFYASLFTLRNPKKPMRAMFIPVRWLGQSQIL